MNISRDQDFTYDWLNSISNFSSPGDGSMTFTYDRYGNRTKQCGSGGAPTMNLTVDANNRVTYRRTDSCTLTPNVAVTYYTTGELKSGLGSTYQYDAEGKMKTVDSGGTAAYA